MKDCGSCDHFIKLTNDRIGGGLCELHDTRTKTSKGKRCPDWTGIKYKKKNRRSSKRQTSLGDYNGRY